MWPWAPCIRQDTSDVPEKPNVTPFHYLFRGHCSLGWPSTDFTSWWISDESERTKRQSFRVTMRIQFVLLFPNLWLTVILLIHHSVTHLGGISGRRKAVHSWKPFVRTGLHKLIAVCCLRRQFAVVVITEAVAGQRRSPCLQSCTCKEAVISAWLSRTMWIMDYYLFKGFMHFTLFIIAPVGLTWEYSHGLRWMCV